VGGMVRGGRFWNGGRWAWCRVDTGLKMVVAKTSSTDLAFIHVGFVLKLGITCMLAAAFPSPVIYSHSWWNKSFASFKQSLRPKTYSNRPWGDPQCGPFGLINQ